MTLDTTKLASAKLDWSKSSGLLPAIVQDADTLRVLMLGYVNQEALDTTLKTGFATFYSRSKQRLWKKGETSGHVMRMVAVEQDCDNDTLLFKVKPVGPACHTGTLTCFGDATAPSLATLGDLARTISARHTEPSASSYTAKLFAEGMARMAQKVGEEGVETALAAVTEPEKLPAEAADLLYHLLVLLEASDLSLDDVLAILHRRAQPKPGH